MRINKAKTDSLKKQRQLAESPSRVMRPVKRERAG